MTASQEPRGPRKSRRLAPDELARDLANRFKLAGGSDGGGKRFLPYFDMLNAGRLIMGLGALVVLAGLVAGFTWLSGLAGYETPGMVSHTSPVYACPGEPELGKVFEGEAITLIGRSPDQLWLAVRDSRGPGNAAYVLQAAVAVEGDVSLLPTRECQPSDGQPIAAGQTTSNDESTTTVATAPTTSTPGETTTTDTTATTAGRPRRRNTPSPGTTTTTTRPGATTTTTRPGATTTTTRPGATTTTTRPTTSSTASSTTTSTSTTSTSTTSTTTSSTTTTTEPTTTTTEITTTTTMATTSTTVP